MQQWRYWTAEWQKVHSDRHGLSLHHSTQPAPRHTICTRTRVQVYRCTLSPLNSTNTTAHNLYTYRYTGVPSTHSTLNSTNTTAQSVHVQVYRCTVHSFTSQLNQHHCTICTRTDVQVYRPLTHLSTQPTPRHTICTRTGVQVYRPLIHLSTQPTPLHTICTRTGVQVYRPLIHLSTQPTPRHTICTHISVSYTGVFYTGVSYTGVFYTNRNRI